MFKIIYSGTITLLTLLFLFNPVQAANNDLTNPLLPGFNLEDTYQNGEGEPVGRILSVKGQAALYHAGQKTAFWIKDNLPLYKGDTVVTLEESLLELGFIDSSRISMGAATHIVISEMLYKENAAERSGFLSITQGKARFWIKKLIKFRRSEFRVKTHTAIAGVRGSDFIIWVKPGTTELFTFKKTRLEVFNPSDPEADPIIMKDFQKFQKAWGQFISQPESMDQDTIERLQREFPFIKVLPLGAPVTGLPLKGKTGPHAGGPVIPQDQLVPPDPASPSHQRDDQYNREPKTMDEFRSETRDTIQDKNETLIEEQQTILPLPQLID